MATPSIVSDKWQADIACHESLSDNLLDAIVDAFAWKACKTKACWRRHDETCAAFNINQEDQLMS